MNECDDKLRCVFRPFDLGHIVFIEYFVSLNVLFLCLIVDDAVDDE